MKNPFLIAGYAGPDYFCDRVTETENLIQALQNGRNVTLISPRRMGKTGLIKNVFHHLRQEQNAHFFYLDLFSTQSLTNFIDLLADTVLGKLDATAQKAMQRVMQFVKSCRPVFTMDELSGMPKVYLERAKEAENSTLKEIFEYLNSAQQPCYIALDEFQQVSNYPENGVEALLRSFIQFSPNIHFIFSGSRMHLMQEIFLSPKRPFYQSTQLMNIAEIDRDAYYSFAQHFFSQQKIDFPEEIFNRIYHDFEGHTWYVQAILNRLYETNKNVDIQLYNQIVEMIISENEYAYQSFFSTLPKGAAKLLKAIAKEGRVKTITSGAFLQKHGIKAASSVARSVTFLLDHELLYKFDAGYSVYDRFMGLWLNRLSF